MIVGNRLPKTIWRVVSTGATGKAYWEPASREYKSRAWAKSAVEEFRRKGADDVKVFRADLTWTEVEIGELMKLATETAESIAYGGKHDGWSHVENVDGDDHRWWREMTHVIRSPEGVTFAFESKQGLTENQENEYPWQEHAYNVPDLEEIDVFPVVAHEVVVTEWRRAK